MSAATGESNPFAALLQGAAGQGGTAGNGAPASSATATPAGGTPNNQPLPNPWASNALAGSGGRPQLSLDISLMYRDEKHDCCVRYLHCLPPSTPSESVPCSSSSCLTDRG